MKVGANTFTLTLTLTNILKFYTFLCSVFHLTFSQRFFTFWYRFTFKFCTIFFLTKHSFLLEIRNKLQEKRRKTLEKDDKEVK